MSVRAARKGPSLSTGTRLVTLGADHVPHTTTVVRVNDGLIWISGGSRPGEPGDTVTLIHVATGDAQYWAPARVELVPPETLALRRIGAWERRQRRAQVRLTTHDVSVDILRIDDLLDARKQECAPMLDVSASGASARTALELEMGEAVQCRFHLPSVGDFELEARVVRVAEARGQSRRVVGFEFLDMTPEQQAALRQWIFAEEARRHQIAKLDAAQGMEP